MKSSSPLSIRSLLIAASISIIGLSVIGGVSASNSGSTSSVHPAVSRVANGGRMSGGEITIVNPPASLASDRFVAEGGTDVANDCLNIGNPCATIAYALTQDPSGTIHVGAGSFTEGAIPFTGSALVLGSQDGTTVTGDFQVSAGNGNVRLRNLTIIPNATQTYSGLAGATNIAVAGTTQLTLDECTIAGTLGARIFAVDSTASLTIQNSALSNGTTAGTGGAVYDNGTLIVSNTYITGCTAANGGAILVQTIVPANVATATITDCTFDTNTASANGGAIFNSINSSVTVSGSTFKTNSAASGGGIHNFSGTVIITNSTFSGNNATGNPGSTGGGINNVLGTLTVNNSTFVRNSADGFGGAIADDVGTFTLNNTILAGSPSGGDFYEATPLSSTLSGSYDLIQDGSFVLFANSIVADPKLGPLQNNGGPTQTCLLALGSPAIDAGNPAFSAPPAQDQRQFPRVANSRVDMGAVEVDYAVNPISGTPQSTPINSTFATPLQATVTESGNVQSGVPVTFTAPLAGASGTFPGNAAAATVNTNGSGIATAPAFTANATAGGYNIIASLAGGSPFGTFALTNLKADQTIIVNTHAPAAAPYNSSFTVAAVATSGLPVTYGSAGVCTNVGAVFTMTASAGTCTVTYNQTGNVNYNPAPQVVETVTAQKANQTITFAPLSNKTFLDPDFTVTATSTSGLAVSLAAAGNCTVTTPSPGTAHLTGAGSCTITASQAGDANFNPATDVPRSFTIAKANQTITFAAIANKVFGDPDFLVAPTADSGLAVTLAASGNCTVTSPAPGTVHLTAAGSCIITASQAGNANFNSATDVTRSFPIAKANQTITFNALANKTFGDADFPVSATASTGLPVSFAATGNCTVTTPSPATVHITGAGSCAITASQAGNSNYNPAPDVVRSFTIFAAPTVMVVTSSVNPSDLNQSVTFTATVSSSFPTPTGSVQFKDNGSNLGAAVALNPSGIAQLSVSTLTAGTHSITADYPGTTNYGSSNGTLSGGQVVRPQPTLSINDVSMNEGDSGTQTMNFTVTLSAASNLTVTTQFASTDATATSPADYTATSGTVTFNPGETTKTIPVTIVSDVNFETDETFSINLSTPVNATITKAVGVGTIKNDDPLGGVISLAQANYQVAEATGVVTITINRGKDSRNPVTIDYATDDTGAPLNCATLNSGLASARCDFTPMLGTLQFAANETQKTVTIPINSDGFPEAPEVFKFNLTNPTGGAVLGTSSATVTITDSPVSSANAIDDTELFVRQQYHDFLNREPDAAGLAFWADNIDKCNDPNRIPPGQTVTQCISTQRIITSAAFFLSIEFRQTGGLVRDFYVAALNRPATGNMPNFIEFTRDTQAAQRGVSVGQGNWQTQLATNRVAFMNDFVMRAEFVGLYPTTDTPAQYVDKLYQHANVTPGSAQERSAAIAEFGSAATAADPGARGRALLRITQNAAFQAREYNRGFVQMQYFGYLRRNPNDPPDNNFDGYNFWVSKLNQAGGDFLQAEMVKAFITSTEYRSRFGP